MAEVEWVRFPRRWVLGWSAAALVFIALAAAVVAGGFGPRSATTLPMAVVVTSGVVAFAIHVAVFRVQVRPEGIFVRSFTRRIVRWSDVTGIDLNHRAFALEVRVTNGRPLRLFVLLEGLTAIPEGIVRYVSPEVRSTWSERSRQLLEGAPR